jgi:hypothetical protein
VIESNFYRSVAIDDLVGSPGPLWTCSADAIVLSQSGDTATEPGAAIRGIPMT